jgi:hypothetical protein
MHPFVAVILICLNSVPSEPCDETTAADVMSNGVENELSCVMGWQDVVARSALANEVGRTAYVKTLCRRANAEPDRRTEFPVFPWNREFYRFLPQTLRRARENGEADQAVASQFPYQPNREFKLA